MRRPAKIAVWTLVFGACAGAGAFVASRTDPFPPGVEDPGARSSSPASRTTSPEPEPGPEPQMWVIEIDSVTRHDFHVGGRCMTRWEGAVQVTIAPDGSAEGTGFIGLVKEAKCDFEVAQVQAREIRLTATGRLSGERLELTFREAGRDPVGSKDLGGLADTLSRMVTSVASGERQKVGVVKPDGELGRFISKTWFQASCTDGC